MDYNAWPYAMAFIQYSTYYIIHFSSSVQSFLKVSMSFQIVASGPTRNIRNLHAPSNHRLILDIPYEGIQLFCVRMFTSLNTTVYT